MFSLVFFVKNKGKNHIDRKARKQTLIKLKIFNLRQSKFPYRVQAIVVLFATNDPQKLFLFFKQVNQNHFKEGTQQYGKKTVAEENFALENGTKVGQ